MHRQCRCLPHLKLAYVCLQAVQQASLPQTCSFCYCKARFCRCLQVPGLSAPIPPGAAFGFQAGGWGKAPVDEHGDPLYGDVFGQNLGDEDDELVSACLQAYDKLSLLDGCSLPDETLAVVPAELYE